MSKIIEYTSEVRRNNGKIEINFSSHLYSSAWRCLEDWFDRYNRSIPEKLAKLNIQDEKVENEIIEFYKLYLKKKRDLEREHNDYIMEKEREYKKNLKRITKKLR